MTKEDIIKLYEQQLEEWANDTVCQYQCSPTTNFKKLTDCGYRLQPFN